MTLEFVFLSISFFILIVFAVMRRRNSPHILYSFSIVTIFYTPALYYIFGGDGYSNFRGESLSVFIFVGIAVCWIYLSLEFFFSVFKFRDVRLNLGGGGRSKIYFSFFILPVLAYYLYFFKSFPLIHFIANNELIARPDTTGDIPSFYTVSTIVAIIFPSAYFYYYSDINGRSKHLLINLAIAFIFVMSGHKGLVVYYFIFIWLYIMNAKVNFKIITVVFLLLINYLIAKGIVQFNGDTLDYVMSSPFRRFFVTQGAGYIHRVDMVLYEGYNYLNANPRGIKFDVFEHMYGVGLIGSAPTFFTGDILVVFGVLMSLVIFGCVTSMILFFSKLISSVKSNRCLFIFWNFYFMLYLLSMAEVSFASAMRLIFAAINVFAILLLCAERKINVYESK